jgi:hypothetical protein
MALIVIAGAVLFNEVPDLPTIIGVGLILMDVVIVHDVSHDSIFSHVGSPFSQALPRSRVAAEDGRDEISASAQ